ncbi:ABC transporter substrate-binding protein [Halotalea alkalilenta]|uniref:ABC transporter substrate-binding protein n=1 Tax=Halotalea alkalilenta TaxID=376489 RepID=UPI0009DCA68C|nr:ABC transporter substrate-binding protein [Halotalea alkalilenta]
MIDPKLLQIDLRKLLGAALLGAGAMAASMPASAQTVNAMMHSGLRVLDPILTTAHITRNHGYMVYDTLLGMDENFRPQPQMADWQVSDDGLTYTFTLREGLEWHDGTPVTAADCVASLQRWGSRDSGGQMLMSHVASLEASDDRTITLTLADQFGYVLELIAKPSSVPAFMMPTRLAETPSDQPIPEQIGSGPFRFVSQEFDPGNRVVYEKFEDYVPRSEPPSWTAGGKVVNVDRVEWLTMPDQQTAVNALNSGDLDFIEQVPIDLLPLLEGSDGVSTGAINPLGYQTMGRMNFLYPPFDDIKVRQAALVALDQEDVLAALIGNPEYYEVCPSFYGCQSPLASDEGTEGFTANGDIERAQALLEEAGYDGTPVVILQPTDVATVSPQPVVAAQALRQAGFNVQLQPMDWQTLVSRRASQQPPSEGGWNLFFTNWIIPEVWNPIVNPMLNGHGREGGFFGWPTDPELDRLRGEFAAAQDDAERERIAGVIQAHALEQVNYIPLGDYRSVSAWSDQLEGLLPGPVPVFWNLTKD